MADLKNVMGVDAGDIKNIMGVSADNIKSVMGFDLSTFTNDQWFGSRHLANGHSADTNRISYKSSTSNGNVSDFGNLVYGNHKNAGNGTGNGKARGIAGARYDSGSSAYSKAIDYYATATTGNASDFGDGDAAVQEGMGMSNGTLLFFAGGGYPYTDRMEYITVATTGNGTDAGNLQMGVNYAQASVSGNTRGAVFGGSAGSVGADTLMYDTVDYITFHTSNNSADFGDLTTDTMENTACASSTRWVMKAGYNPNASGAKILIHMDYFTADTTGNASDFGDVADRTRTSAGMADGTRGEFWGGHDATPFYGNLTDAIAYITIASAGDGTDAGNLHASGTMNHLGLSGAAS